MAIDYTKLVLAATAAGMTVQEIVEKFQIKQQVVQEIIAQNKRGPAAPPFQEPEEERPEPERRQPPEAGKKSRIRRAADAVKNAGKSGVRRAGRSLASGALSEIDVEFGAAGRVVTDAVRRRMGFRVESDGPASAREEVEKALGGAIGAIGSLSDKMVQVMGKVETGVRTAAAQIKDKVDSFTAELSRDRREDEEDRQEKEQKVKADPDSGKQEQAPPAASTAAAVGAGLGLAGLTGVGLLSGAGDAAAALPPTSDLNGETDAFPVPSTPESDLESRDVDGLTPAEPERGAASELKFKAREIVFAAREITFPFKNGPASGAGAATDSGTPGQTTGSGETQSDSSSYSTPDTNQDVSGGPVEFSGEAGDAIKRTDPGNGVTTQKTDRKGSGTSGSLSDMEPFDPSKSVLSDSESELGKRLADPEARRKLPAGMRNNNPGNIKYTKNSAKWAGVTGPSENTDQGDPQAVFATPEDGMRAMHRLIKRKYQGGKKTANQLIAEDMGWTPGNYKAAGNVAKTMGIGADDPIDFDDPKVASAFMRALIKQEHGPSGSLYSDELIQAAIAAGEQPTQVASAEKSKLPTWDELNGKKTDEAGASAPWTTPDEGGRRLTQRSVDARIGAETGTSPSAVAEAQVQMNVPRIYEGFDSSRFGGDEPLPSVGSKLNAMSVEKKLQDLKAPTVKTEETGTSTKTAPSTSLEREDDLDKEPPNTTLDDHFQEGFPGLGKTSRHPGLGM